MNVHEMLIVAHCQLGKIIDSEFEYLRMCGFREVGTGTVEVITDNVATNHKVHNYINGEQIEEGCTFSYESELSEAIAQTKIKINEIYKKYKNIAVRLYPVATCNINCSGEIGYSIKFRMAHWNDD